jgi:hypothetical protein
MVDICAFSQLLLASYRGFASKSRGTGFSPWGWGMAGWNKNMAGWNKNKGAGPATGPLRYSGRDRTLDYRRGLTDARRHLPFVPRKPALGTGASQLAIPGVNGKAQGQQAASISLTPFLYELFSRRTQDLAALHKLYLSERRRLLDALREADGSRQHLLMKQAAAQERLVQFAQSLTEEEASRVTYGEKKAGHPEELTRMRRERARKQDRQNEQRLLDEINDDLLKMAVAAGKAQDALESMLEELQSSGTEIVSYYEQRKASYFSGLTHKHRRNVELLEQLQLTDPGLPDWLPWDPNALDGT